MRFVIILYYLQPTTSPLFTATHLYLPIVVCAVNKAVEGGNAAVFINHLCLVIVNCWLISVTTQRWNFRRIVGCCLCLLLYWILIFSKKRLICPVHDLTDRYVYCQKTNLLVYYDKISPMKEKVFRYINLKNLEGIKSPKTECYGIYWKCVGTPKIFCDVPSTKHYKNLINLGTRLIHKMRAWHDEIAAWQELIRVSLHWCNVIKKSTKRIEINATLDQCFLLQNFRHDDVPIYFLIKLIGTINIIIKINVPRFSLPNDILKQIIPGCLTKVVKFILRAR